MPVVIDQETVDFKSARTLFVERIVMQFPLLYRSYGSGRRHAGHWMVKFPPTPIFGSCQNISRWLSEKIRRPSLRFVTNARRAVQFTRV